MNRLSTALLLIALAGCSSTAAVVEPPVERPRVTWADVEDLDVAAYEDEPTFVEIEVSHDVPARLMENRADAGLDREVSGYRIQIYSTIELDAATAVESETRRWLARSVTPGQSPIAVYRLFRQPYYRIRVGDYATRVDAEDALEDFSGRFRRAMIVPDVVTIRK